MYTVYSPVSSLPGLFNVCIKKLGIGPGNEFKCILAYNVYL